MDTAQVLKNTVVALPVSLHAIADPELPEDLGEDTKGYSNSISL